jgi:chromate transporter
MPILSERAELTAQPGLMQITLAFIRYANFTLGGGSATISVIHRGLLEKRGWFATDQFGLCYALSRVTPGTNLLAFCTGIGWLLRRLPGALLALLAASIPCALIVVLATALFDQWQSTHWAQVAIHGAIAAAVAITVRTCWTIAGPHFKGPSRVRVALVATTAFVLYLGLNVPPIEVLLLAGTVGAVLPPVRA